MSAATIQEIELSMSEAKAVVDLGKSVERLRKNRDFKKVIEETYLREEAVRLVHLKSSPAMQRPEVQAGIDSDIKAIGSFAQFLDTISAMAERAASELEDGEQALEELRAEGAEE